MKPCEILPDAFRYFVRCTFPVRIDQILVPIRVPVLFIVFQIPRIDFFLCESPKVILRILPVVIESIPYLEIVSTFPDLFIRSSSFISINALFPPLYVLSIPLLPVLLLVWPVPVLVLLFAGASQTGFRRTCRP